MSKLYAVMAVDGRWQNKLTRRAHNYATSQLASWHGAIETEIVAKPDGSITYRVHQIQWQGKGENKLIATGVLKEADSIEPKKTRKTVSNSEHTGLQCSESMAELQEIAEENNWS